MRWDAKKKIENEYRIAIVRFWKGLLNALDDIPLLWPDRLRELAKSDLAEEYALKAASNMVTHLRVDGAKTWREAAAISGRSREISQALQQELKGPIGASVRNLIEENARLIKSVPIEAADKLDQWISDQTHKGARAEAMTEEIKRRTPNLTQGRARLIARTETSKAQTDLTQARSERLGVGWYIWRTAFDGTRVRKSHRHMEGVLVRWSDPPSPESLIGLRSTLGHYHAGKAPNCRCNPEPLLNIKQIQSDRVKVYQNGQIIRMTISQFTKLAA